MSNLMEELRYIFVSDLTLKGALGLASKEMVNSIRVKKWSKIKPTESELHELRANFLTVRNGGTDFDVEFALSKSMGFTINQRKFKREISKTYGLKKQTKLLWRALDSAHMKNGLIRIAKGILSDKNDVTTVELWLNRIPPQYRTWIALKTGKRFAVSGVAIETNTLDESYEVQPYSLIFDHESNMMYEVHRDIAKILDQESWYSNVKESKRMSRDSIVGLRSPYNVPDLDESASRIDRVNRSKEILKQVNARHRTPKNQVIISYHEREKSNAGYTCYGGAKSAPASFGKK